MILTPGSKARMLVQLEHLISLVREDAERDILLFRTAELMAPVANSFAFYTPEQVTTKKKRKLPRDRAYAVDLGDEGR